MRGLAFDKNSFLKEAIRRAKFVRDSFKLVDSKSQLKPYFYGFPYLYYSGEVSPPLTEAKLANPALL